MARWALRIRIRIHHDKQMQPMQVYILTCGTFGGSFENTQRRNAKQMQPMQLYICLCKPFKDSFENTMWLCILSDRRSEETFENAQWRHLKRENVFFLGIAQITSPTIFITFRGPDHVPVRYMCGNIFDATAKLKKHYVSILEKGPKRHNSLTTHTCKNRKAFRQCGGPCPSPPRLCPSLVRSKSCESKN